VKIKAALVMVVLCGVAMAADPTGHLSGHRNWRCRRETGLPSYMTLAEVTRNKNLEDGVDSLFKRE